MNMISLAFARRWPVLKIQHQLSVGCVALQRRFHNNYAHDGDCNRPVIDRTALGEMIAESIRYTGRLHWNLKHRDPHPQHDYYPKKHIKQVSMQNIIKAWQLYTDAASINLLDSQSLEWGISHAVSADQLEKIINSWSKSGWHIDEWNCKLFVSRMILFAGPSNSKANLAWMSASLSSKSSEDLNAAFLEVQMSNEVDEIWHVDMLQHMMACPPLTVDAAWAWMETILGEVMNQNRNLQIAAPAMLDIMIRKVCLGSAEQRKLLATAVERGVKPLPTTYKELMWSLLIEEDVESADDFARTCPDYAHETIQKSIRTLELLNPDELRKTYFQGRMYRLRYNGWLGPRGTQHAQWLIETLCRRKCKVDLCSLAAYHIEYNMPPCSPDHAELLTLLMTEGGIVPDVSVYSAMIARHRLEGDEAIARKVCAQAGKVVDLADRRIIKEKESDLKRRRATRLWRALYQGGQNAIGAVLMYNNLTMEGRCDDSLTALVLQHYFWSFKFAECERLFRSSDGFPLSLGETYIEVDKLNRECALTCAALHLSWLRDQIKQNQTSGVEFGSWTCNDLIFESKSEDQFHQVLAIAALMSHFDPPLKFEISNETTGTRVTVSAKNLQTWGVTCEQTWQSAAAELNKVWLGPNDGPVPSWNVDTHSDRLRSVQ